ncbi:hypothetical protein D3C76_1636650 [compost metagenome]
MLGAVLAPGAPVVVVPLLPQPNNTETQRAALAAFRTLERMIFSPLKWIVIMLPLRLAPVGCYHSSKSVSGYDYRNVKRV